VVCICTVTPHQTHTHSLSHTNNKPMPRLQRLGFTFSAPNICRKSYSTSLQSITLTLPTNRHTLLQHPLICPPINTTTHTAILAATSITASNHFLTQWTRVLSFQPLTNTLRMKRMLPVTRKRHHKFPQIKVRETNTAILTTAITGICKNYTG
jgi:hypothetical protein